MLVWYVVDSSANTKIKKIEITWESNKRLNGQKKVSPSRCYSLGRTFNPAQASLAVDCFEDELLENRWVYKVEVK